MMLKDLWADTSTRSFQAELAKGAIQESGCACISFMGVGQAADSGKRTAFCLFLRTTQVGGAGRCALVL
jgi:hypothetical protein